MFTNSKKKKKKNEKEKEKEKENTVYNIRVMPLREKV